MSRRLGGFTISLSKHFQFPFQTKQTAVNLQNNQSKHQTRIIKPGVPFQRCVAHIQKQHRAPVVFATDDVSGTHKVLFPCALLNPPNSPIGLGTSACSPLTSKTSEPWKGHLLPSRLQSTLLILTSHLTEDHWDTGWCVL